MRRINRILKNCLPILMLVGFSATAQQMDENSRILLINKLEKINSDLTPKDEAKQAIVLRLADLYAEKGRLAAMKQLQDGCTDCTAGTPDRLKSLKYYSEVLETLPPALKGKVLVQMGHLYELAGEEQKAISFYSRILKESVTTEEAKAEANLSLGEIYFKRRDFATAKGYYALVAKSPKSNRGLAAYRKAWSTFNMGQLDLAVNEIVEVLKSPVLLSRSSQPGAPIDPQFHEEASRDYATFLSKVKISKSDVENLYALSPESTRTNNVMLLALDAERLGKKQEAFEAWTFVFPHLNKPVDRMSAQISMAQLQYDLGNKAEALKNFEAGMILVQEQKACATSECVELKRRARHLVVNWNQTEKKAPSEQLFTAYERFLAVFPEDVDMNIYAAEVARFQKKYPISAQYYTQAQNLLAKDPKDKDKLESVLLSHVEVAETAKDEALEMKAYQDYLSMSPTQDKSFLVRYQVARYQYEKSDYKNAAENLRLLAIDKKGDIKVRKQAADLSLDALVLLKDEVRVGVWAAEYSGIFPGEDSATYARMAQKSVLNQSANLADSDKAAAFTTLMAFDVKKASAEDKLKYYKNKLILAEKLKRYPEAQIAATEMLKQPGLTKEDIEFAWARKAYMAEMTLDFATAMTATEKLETTLTPEEKALKIALFAELSGKASAPYYAKYLKITQDEEAKMLVATELVKASDNLEKAIEAYKPYLVKNSVLLANFYAKAYAKNPSEVLRKKVVNDPKLKETEVGKLLTRLAFLKDFEAAKAKIVAHTLDTSNDRNLVRTIKARAKLLNNIEALASKAIDNQDWTSQLVSIDLVAKESERFYQELISAPMPAGLTPEEEGQYLNLLSQQAAPFQAKAIEAKQKVAQFWAQPGWQQSLKTSWKQEDVRSLISVEIETLKSIAPEATLPALADVTVEVIQPVAVKPTKAEIEAARLKVNKDPLNRSAIEELLVVEQKAENKPMVQYLQTRLQTLDKEKMVN